MTSRICSESNPRSATRSLLSEGSIGRRLTFLKTSRTPSSIGAEVGWGMDEVVRVASDHEETIKQTPCTFDGWGPAIHDAVVPMKAGPLLLIAPFLFCAVLGAQIDPRTALVEL